MGIVVRYQPPAASIAGAAAAGGAEERRRWESEYRQRAKLQQAQLKARREEQSAALEHSAAATRAQLGMQRESMEQRERMHAAGLADRAQREQAGMAEQAFREAEAQDFKLLDAARKAGDHQSAEDMRILLRHRREAKARVQQVPEDSYAATKAQETLDYAEQRLEEYRGREHEWQPPSPQERLGQSLVTDPDTGMLFLAHPSGAFNPVDPTKSPDYVANKMALDREANTAKAQGAAEKAEEDRKKYVRGQLESWEDTRRKMALAERAAVEKAHQAIDREKYPEPTPDDWTAAAKAGGLKAADMGPWRERKQAEFEEQKERRKAAATERVKREFASLYPDPRERDELARSLQPAPQPSPPRAPEVPPAQMVARQLEPLRGQHIDAGLLRQLLRELGGDVGMLERLVAQYGIKPPLQQ